MAENEKSNAAGGGIGFFGVLGIVFIVLKLCKVIDWDWIWVLAPLWMPITIVFAIFLVILICAAFLYTLAGIIQLFGK